MHAGDYAWILPGETIDLSGMTVDWWHSPGSGDCSPSQLTQTLNGLIIVNSYGTVLTQELSSSGLVCAFYSYIHIHILTLSYKQYTHEYLSL